jgi:hypothetical protein
VLINPTENDKIVMFGKTLIDMECFDKAGGSKPEKARKQPNHKWHAGFLKSFTKNDKKPESERK